MKKIIFFEIIMKNRVSDFIPTGVIYFDEKEALKHVENENKDCASSGIVYFYKKIEKCVYNNYDELKQENEKNIIL